MCLQAAWDDFARVHPQMMRYIDDGICSRIAAIAATNVPRAVAAVKVLEETRYPSDMQKSLKNPSAYMMGVLNNGLKSIRA